MEIVVGIIRLKSNLPDISAGLLLQRAGMSYHPVPVLRRIGAEVGSDRSLNRRAQS